jgi:hypothetical protein
MLRVGMHSYLICRFFGVLKIYTTTQSVGASEGNFRIEIWYDAVYVSSTIHQVILVFIIKNKIVVQLKCEGLLY